MIAAELVVGSRLRAVIFAGSLEFLILEMVVAMAPLASIAATAFLVNFRHVFYALSFPLPRSWPRRQGLQHLHLDR